MRILFALMASLATSFNVNAVEHIPYFQSGDPFKPYMYYLQAKLTRPYQIVVIEHDAVEGEEATSHKGAQILELAKRGKAEEMKAFRRVIGEKFPGQYSATDMDKMEAMDRIEGLHSSRILVLEGGKPLAEAKIMGGIRLVAEGDNGKGLDFEESIEGYRFEREWELILPFAERVEYMTWKPTGEWMGHKPMLVGGVIQLTGFFNNGLPEVAALMNLVASQFSLKRPHSMPDVVLTPAMRKTYRELTRGEVNVPDRLTLWPYWLASYSDRDLAEKYYLPIMKFENVNPQGGAVQGRLYVLRKPLNEFRAVSEGNYLFRKGRALIHENGISRVYATGGDIHYNVIHGIVQPYIDPRAEPGVGPGFTPGGGSHFVVAPRVYSEREKKLDGLFNACEDELIPRYLPSKPNQPFDYVLSRPIDPWR